MRVNISTRRCRGARRGERRCQKIAAEDSRHYTKGMRVRHSPLHQSVLLHGRIDLVRPGVDATCEIERAFVTVAL